MSDQLPPHARALLTALQREDTPDAEEQRRVKQQVFARLGLGVLGAAAATSSTVASHATISSTVASHAATSSTVASHAATTSAAGSAVGAGTGSGGLVSLLAAKVGTTKVVIGLTAALAAVGGTALWSQTHDESVRLADGATVMNPAPLINGAPAFSLNVPPAATEAPTLFIEPAAELLVAPQVPSAEASAVTRRKVPDNSNRWGGSSSLEEEAQLLAQAHQKISQGNPRAAMSLLLDHQKRFPRGTLGLERQATLAVARCLAGETTRGRTEAERFRRKHPNSPMVKRLETACQLAKP